MISGGMPTVFVTDMDTAVRFYTESLELRLAQRYGNHWASIDAGHGLTIGLHPASPHNPAGQRASMTIGFHLSEPIQHVVSRLKGRGVFFSSDIIDDTELLIAHFRDPDGNEFYVSELKYATGDKG